MGRVVTALLLAILAVIAAALVVPSFIDWTQFRKPIEAEASRLTGRQVRITGNIGLGLLLRPHIELGGLTVADPGKPDAPMLQAGRLNATAAWWPLFRGRIEIAQLRLSDATVRVRISRTGAVNWSLAETVAKPGRRPDSSILAPRGFFAAPLIISPKRLSFSDVVVERSTLLYTDERNGANDRLDKLSGRFSLKGLYGPWTGNAGFQIDNAAISLGFSVGAATGPHVASPVTIKIGVLDANGSLTIKGNANGLAQAIDQLKSAPLTFTGTVELAASQSVPFAKGLGALAEFGSDPNTRPPSLVWSHLRSLPVAANGSLNLDTQNLQLNAQGALGHTRATLAFLRTRKAPQIDLTLNSDLVDLDEMLDLHGAGGRLATAGAVSGPVQSLAVCRCTGNVRVGAKTLTLGGASLSDLAVAVKLGLDGADLTDAHISLPGEARLSTSGHMPRPTLAKNGVMFDGKVNFNAGNPRGFAAWLGVKADRMSPNAFKTLSLQGPFKLEDRASVAATAGDHTLTPHLDRAALTLDDQSLTLSAAYDARDPGYILFALEGDRLDADAYGIGFFWPARVFDAHEWSRTLWSRALKAGEVSVKVSLANLKTAGKMARGFEAELKRSPLGAASAHVSVGNLGGYQILFEGERKRASGGSAGDETAKLTVAGPGAPIQLPFAGRPLQGSLKLNVAMNQSSSASNWSLDGSIGSTRLSGEGSGGSSEKLIPDIDHLSLNAKFDRGTAALGGSLKQLTVEPVFDGNLTVDANDFPSFMRELGFTYEPRRKDLGALSLVSQFSASLDHVGVASLSMSVGDDALAATADLNLASPRAVLNADVKATKISLDGYLKAPEKGALWSAERLKLDLFRRFDGEIKFAADHFAVGPWDMRGLSSAISFKDGAVSTRNARANLYGGAMSFTGQAQLGDDDAVATTFDANVQTFDWTKAAAKLFSGLGTDGSGTASAHIAGSASGRSMVGLVSSFSGRAEVSGIGGVLKGFNLQAWGAGLNGARGPDALSRLSKAVLMSGETGVTNFRISASGTKGTLTIGQGMVTMNGGGGEVSGHIDLVPRTMVVRLALVPAAEPELPAAEVIVSGPIDKPVQKINIQALSASVSGQ